MNIRKIRGIKVIREGKFFNLSEMDDDVLIYENNCMTKLSCDVVKTWLEVLRES